MKTVRSMMAILALAVSIEMGAQGIIRPKTTPAPNVTHTTPSKSKTQKRTVQTRKSGPSRRQLLDQAVRDMVRVEGGTYTMGLTKGMQDAVGWASPAHRVTVSSFFISKYEVTQAPWRAVMGSNPSRFKGDNRPVEHVSWDDCQLFLSRLRTLTGYSFRLPTEAEWEYAARGGNRSRGYVFSGSDNLYNVAWYKGNSDMTPTMWEAWNQTNWGCMTWQAMCLSGAATLWATIPPARPLTPKDRLRAISAWCVAITGVGRR